MHRVLKKNPQKYNLQHHMKKAAEHSISVKHVGKLILL